MLRNTIRIGPTLNGNKLEEPRLIRLSLAVRNRDQQRGGKQ